MREKSWQLSGEVLASARPENSLLAETLDFEYMTRQGTSVKLEESSSSLHITELQGVTCHMRLHSRVRTILVLGYWVLGNIHRRSPPPK